jgi:hypothetical protein
VSTLIGAPGAAACATPTPTDAEASVRAWQQDETSASSKLPLVRRKPRPGYSLLSRRVFQPRTTKVKLVERARVKPDFEKPVAAVALPERSVSFVASWISA